MGRSVLKVQGYTAEQIKAIINSNSNYSIGIKLYAIYQVAKGQPSRQLEELYHTSFKQILNWTHSFEKEGTEGLKLKEGRGRKPRLNETQLQSLKNLFKCHQSRFQNPRRVININRSLIINELTLLRNLSE